MKRRKKKMYLIILLLLISLGYALFSTKLSINGVGKVDDINWNIHFENVAPTKNSNIMPTVAPNTTQESNFQEINYEIKFTAAGQIYEFTADIVNAGTIDAMIKEFKSKIKIGNNEELLVDNNGSNLPSCLIYDITYSDDTSIQENQLLKSNTSEKIKVRIGISVNATQEQIETINGKNIYLNIMLDYIQANGSETEAHIRDTYTISNVYVMKIGETIRSTINLRDNPYDAMEDWAVSDMEFGRLKSGRPIFLKQVVNKEFVVKESSVGFYIPYELAKEHEGIVPGIYYLKYGKEFYEENIDIIKTAFGAYEHEDRCFETDLSYINDYEIDCRVLFSNDRKIIAGTHLNGRVDVSDGDKYCVVDSEGVSTCSG